MARKLHIGGLDKVGGGKNRNFAAHFGKCCSYGATLRQPLPSQNRRPKHLKIASLLSPLNLVIPNSPIVRNPYPTRTLSGAKSVPRLPPKRESHPSPC